MCIRDSPEIVAQVIVLQYLLFRFMNNDTRGYIYTQELKNQLANTELRGIKDHFDIESGETRVRLELQYEESHDYLTALIQEQHYNGVRSPSLERMQDAYTKILRHFQLYAGIDELIAFANYCLTKIELVVIESQDLSSALKIFETVSYTHLSPFPVFDIALDGMRREKTANKFPFSPGFHYLCTLWKR